MFLEIRMAMVVNVYRRILQVVQLDKATFEKPHQYAVGVNHVFVNGIQVLNDGEHTGAKPGMLVRGPGWIGWENESQ